MNALEEQVLLVISHLVPLVEACGALIVVLGVIRTFAYHLRRMFSLDPTSVASARLQLVRSLVIGLEFQVAADVLRTAISPTWNAISSLAAIVVLRAALSYLLEREERALCVENPAVKDESAVHKAI